MHLLKGAQGSPAEAIQTAHRPGVVVGFGFGCGAQGGTGIGDVAVRGIHPVAAQEGEHPLAHSVGLELVGEDRGDGHRQAIGDVQHRQV